MKPTAIPNVTVATLAPLRSGFGKFIQTLSSPFSTTGRQHRPAPPRPRIITNIAAAKLNPELSPHLNGSATSEGLEMFDSGKDLHALEGTKAERRYYDSIMTSLQLNLFFLDSWPSTRMEL